MDTEERLNITSDVTDASNDILPSVALTGLNNLESSADTFSSLNPSRLINKEGFINESINQTFELQQSTEVEHLEDNLIDVDSFQNYEETNSESSGSFCFKQTDSIVNMAQNCKQIFNHNSHQVVGAAILSETDSPLVVKTLHKIQQMDASEISAPKSSEKSTVESKNVKKVENNLEVKENASLKNIKTEAGTMLYWEDEIDLLGEDSPDGGNQSNNFEELDGVTVNTVYPILSGQSTILKPGELEISSSPLKTVNNDDKIESLFGNCGSEKTVPQTDTGDVTESMEVDEMMIEDVNVVDELSKNVFGQPHSKSLECEIHNEKVLLKEHVTPVNKASETVQLFDNLCDKSFFPGPSICNDVKDQVSSAKIALNIGSQESDMNVSHDKVGTQIYNAKKEKSLQVTNVNSDVSPEVLEIDNLNDSTLEASSLNSAMSKNISSCEFSKLAAAVNKSDNEMSILKTIKQIMGPTFPSLPDNPAFAVELASANMSQSCSKRNADLPNKDAVVSNVGFQEADIANKISQVPDTYELADGNTSDKSISHQLECDLETQTTEALNPCNENSNSGVKALMKNNGPLSKNGSITDAVGISCSNDEDGPGSEEILEIKSELCDLNSATDDLSTLHRNEFRSTEIKQELNTTTADDSEEDVIIIDDEGEFVQLKTEIMTEPKTSENGQNIQIPTIYRQQQTGHDSTEDSCKAFLNDEDKSESSGSKLAKSKTQICVVCQKMTKCKYNIVRNGDIKHLCDDACFREFRKRPSSFLKFKSSSSVDRGSKSTLKDTQASSLEAPVCQNVQRKTCSVCQLMDVSVHQPFCNWKGLDFCGELCLEKFQGNLSTSCSFCHSLISKDARTTYCLKIGNDVRPFCRQKCYSEFQKKLRLCSFCQRDVVAIPGTFTSTKGTDGKLKEFCSLDCMKRQKSQRNEIEILSAEKANLKLETITCSVCEKQGPMKFTVRLHDKVKQNKLCSDLCLSAFQYTNKINIIKCDYCFVTCTTEEAQAHFVQFEGNVKHFCSNICVSRFRTANSKVVPCGWCNIQKLNFDMIERLDLENKSKMFCSLNCLSLFRVNLQAKSNQSVPCDQCRKVVPAQYHLTMSDASVLNFCSYPCVMTFQTQFTVKSVSPGNVSMQTPSAAVSTQTQQHATTAQQATGSSKGGRMTTRQVSKQQTPIISNVVSLAASVGDLGAQSILVPPLAPQQMVNSVEASTGMTDGMVSSDGKHQIIIQAAPPKYGKNKSLQCRPLTQTKATSCRPHSQNKEVQTDEIVTHPVFIPIPVPVYIPMPSIMFSAPAPKLIPFPIPIPVPVFIPTTRKSVSGICKTIQDIVERIPADPLEAELLMMAEAVAADKTSEDEASEAEAEADIEDFGVHVENYVLSPTLALEEPETVGMKVNYGEEDVLQTALRVAEEMSGPVEDLETSVQLVAVSTEAPGNQQKTVQSKRIPDDDDDTDTDYNPPQSIRGRVKRPTRGRPPSSRHKRQRLDESLNGEEDSIHSEPPSQIQFIESPADANYHLKYTYGLNAWRHWVISKNIQIEKSNSAGSFRARPFPTDILKSTMDELNISLCMFVKEVRKPGGQEYSPDSIYYLCLGLQQYLFENGRIDSVFTDLYFEKFTEKLHELLQNFELKLNSRGQMLCRIEEEHLWESKQLGAHSPFVLLNTLVYFHTKFFILKTVEEHMSLSFAQILKHWKKGMPLKGQAASSMKNVSLRYYCLVNGKKDSLSARNRKEGVPVYEVTENIENPLRCPVKLYEFFLSKCPESIKNRNDIFYPIPERSCVPDSPVWYSTLTIDSHSLNKMLTRILLIREIQEAILHASPIYL